MLFHFTEVKTYKLSRGEYSNFSFPEMSNFLSTVPLLNIKNNYCNFLLEKMRSINSNILW